MHVMKKTKICTLCVRDVKRHQVDGDIQVRSEFWVLQKNFANKLVGQYLWKEWWCSRQ